MSGCIFAPGSRLMLLMERMNECDVSISTALALKCAFLTLFTYPTEDD